MELPPSMHAFRATVAIVAGWVSACGAGEPPESARAPAEAVARSRSEPAPEAQRDPPAGTRMVEPRLVETASVQEAAELIGIGWAEGRWVVALRREGDAPRLDRVALHAFPGLELMASRELPAAHHASSLVVHEGMPFLIANDLGDTETIEVLPFDGGPPVTRVDVGRGVVASAFRTPRDGVVITRGASGSTVHWVVDGSIERSIEHPRGTGEAVGVSPSGLAAMVSEAPPGLGPYGPATVSIVPTHGAPWQRRLSTPTYAGAGGAVVLDDEGVAHAFVHGLTIDDAVGPTWWRVHREGPPSITRVPSDGEGYGRGQAIAACKPGVALVQGRRHGSQVRLRVWMGTEPGQAGALALWQGDADGSPRLSIGCHERQALVVGELGSGLQLFRVDRD